MSAIGVHHTDTDTGAWDGPANEARLRAGESAAYYRRAFAWQDPDGDPETKAAYKFIHHFVNADGEIGPASTVAGSTGIGVLNGGRGGATIPEGDRRGVYNHLAAHLRDADLEPPDLRSLDPGPETRFIPAEMRVEPDGSIGGYAAVFNEWSEILGWFKEKIRPGAFRKTIKEHDIRALFNHDPNYVLGRRRAETLELKEDKHGLVFKVNPPDTQWANDLRVSIQRGDIDQASFQFDSVRDSWDWNAEPNERELIEAKLYDISVVTFPAYPHTTVSARSLAEQFISQVRQTADPELLAYLRDQISLLDATQPSAPDQAVHPEESDDDEKARARRLNSFRKLRLQLLNLENFGGQRS